MSRAGWERQALNSIQSVLGHTDPKLASHLAGFSRLASGEEMPAHEWERSPLRHPPYRRRSPPAPRKSAVPRSRPAASRDPDLASHLRHFDHRRSDSQQRRSGRVPPYIWNLRRLAPGRRAEAWAATKTPARGHRASGSGLAAIRYDPQDTQPSDIDLWQREIIVRGRAGKPGRPLSPRRAG
jgi:hypothetical protein